MVGAAVPQPGDAGNVAGFLVADGFDDRGYDVVVSDSGILLVPECWHVIAIRWGVSGLSLS